MAPSGFKLVHARTHAYVRVPQAAVVALDAWDVDVACRSHCRHVASASKARGGTEEHLLRGTCLLKKTSAQQLAVCRAEMSWEMRHLAGHGREVTRKGAACTGCGGGQILRTAGNVEHYLQQDVLSVSKTERLDRSIL
mmetsp:Transcript_35494/g.66111  ORF Transcript_35494/g.66111 Transcript_35494/m.66111 type:complete len:138 (+) Transcript_35494:475-888(+)